MKSQVLVKLLAFSCLLLAVRLLKTGHFSFIFLLWNLFLAWLPYWLIKRYNIGTKSGLEQFGILFVCILFLPNAPYILTDLFHLSENLVAPQWFDLILILSFSMQGLLYFILVTDRLFKIITTYFDSNFKIKCVRLLLLLANGYGIYVGRYLRFNSWDIVSNPIELTCGMFSSVFDKSNCKETIAMTITYTIFLYLVMEIYQALKNKEDAIHELS